jgi:hypothetical protein
MVLFHATWFFHLKIINKLLFYLYTHDHEHDHTPRTRMNAPTLVARFVVDLIRSVKLMALLSDTSS